MKTINGLTIFTAWRNVLSKMQATKHSGQKRWSQYAEYYFSFGMFSVEEPSYRTFVKYCFSKTLSAH